MKLKRVKVSDEELDRVAKQSDDYKHGYFSGYVKGRDGQYSADLKATRETRRRNE